MNKPLHIYTAKELSHLRQIDWEVQNFLEIATNQAYLYASSGRKNLRCVAQKEIAQRAKPILENIGYTVTIIPFDPSPGMPAYYEVLIEW